MLIKRDVIDKIGLMDERFGLGGFDDTDYSMRAHLAGYRSYCVYSSYVFHKEHQSFDAMGDRKALQEAAEKEYFKKWPRHLRAAEMFSLDKNTADREIDNLLSGALTLAREWCWVNLWIFSDKGARHRIEKRKAAIKFPLHQNVKFNYLRRSLKHLEIFFRLLERSFGAKRRKKYDLVLYDAGTRSPFTRALAAAQGGKTCCVDFGAGDVERLKEIIRDIRQSGDQNGGIH